MTDVLPEAKMGALASFLAAPAARILGKALGFRREAVEKSEV